jgi:hypothetical protein
MQEQQAVAELAATGSSWTESGRGNGKEAAVKGGLNQAGFQTGEDSPRMIEAR